MSTGSAVIVFVCASLKRRILPDTGIGIVRKYAPLERFDGWLGREKVLGYGGCGWQEHYCRVGSGKDGRIPVLCLSHASPKGAAKGYNRFLECSKSGDIHQGRDGAPSRLASGWSPA